MPIIDIQRRLHEAGRIRIGQQVPTGKGKTRPAKLEDFRFTSADKRSLDSIAAQYGGEVSPWEGAPAGEQWQVFTQAREIAVLVPPEHMSFSQFNELWSGGGCQRRCDGQWETISDRPCLCDPDARECKPHTRLSVMLAALPGTGLWRLDTQGYYAAVELGGALDLSSLVSRATGRSILPGRLRLDQREVKRPGVPTRKFAVPVLDLDVDMVALARGGVTSVQPVEGMDNEAASLAQSRPGLTPVPQDELSVPSLAEQMATASAPRARTTRANAAEPMKRTGLPPRAAQTKEDEDEAQPALQPATEPLSPTLDNGEPRVTPAMIRNLHRLFGLFGVTDRDVRLKFCGEHGGRPVGTMNDLSVAEANKIMDKLAEFTDGESVAS